MEIVKIMDNITQNTHGNGGTLIMESGCALVEAFGTARTLTESSFFRYQPNIFGTDFWL